MTTATYCFRRAVELGPHSSPILLRTANFEFQTGLTNDALLRLRRILTDSGEYDTIAFSLFDRLGGSTAGVLGSGLPDARRPAQAYFRHLIARDDFASSNLVWQWMQDRRLTDKPVGLDWVNFLLSTRHLAQAQSIFVHEAGQDGGDYPDKNLLFNGDFKSKPLNSNLDWRITPHSSVAAVVEDGALHVKFTGTENVAYANVMHQGILTAGAYVLRAEMRSDKITTNEGVWLQLVDADSPGRLNLRTGPLTGTVPQRAERLNFTIIGEPRLIELRVMRTPSAKFDSRIAGDFWLDRVVIAPAEN